GHASPLQTYLPCTHPLHPYYVPSITITKMVGSASGVSALPTNFTAINRADTIGFNNLRITHELASCADGNYFFKLISKLSKSRQILGK
ncbi:hypothetical protein, partial [Microcoleus sp. herbarium12]|uniref:hypothetical protein n=1 Tax=Microcoleus sp. herbarium12 TaxID=3055437 RepID=UPI002FD73897